jgi:hypothetical protein
MKQLNKDFYDKLPSMVCEQLDNSIIPKLCEKEGFNEVWEEYRQHILNTNMDDMKMPYSIFKKIDK